VPSQVFAHGYRFVETPYKFFHSTESDSHRRFNSARGVGIQSNHHSTTRYAFLHLPFFFTGLIFLGEGDFAKRTVRSLFAHLRNSGIDYKKVWREIIHVITLSLLALAPSVRTANPHAFELFGFDILLTQDLKPHLIEVNLAPSLAVSGPTDHIVKQVCSLLYFVVNNSFSSRLYRTC
jgi:hypothetical protein